MLYDGNDGGFQVVYCGIEKTFPFLLMGFKSLEPAVVCPGVNAEGFTYFFHTTHAKEMLCKDAEYETEAVAAIRNDWIRKDCMCGRPLAGSADKSWDAQGFGTNPVADIINKLACIVGMDAQLPLTAAVRTDFCLRAGRINAAVKNHFYRSFF